MKSLLASVRAGGGLDRVDHAVQLLEDEWRKHGDVPLERLWAEQKRLLESDADEPVILLAELIRTDLRCRFARGQTPTVAEYLGRFPELASRRQPRPEPDLRGILPERGARRSRSTSTSFCDRYPRWKESLVSQLQYHHLFSQAAGVRPKAPPFPEPGDTFEEFQLVSLLGRGGTSRVFLARDLSLGGKQVVLKVSMDRGREPQAQGRWTIRTSSRSTPSSSTTARCAACRCPTARGCRSTRSSAGSTPPRGPAARWPSGRPWSGRRRRRPKPAGRRGRAGSPRSARRGPGATAGRVSRSGAPMPRAWPGSSRSIAEALHYAHGAADVPPRRQAGERPADPPAWPAAPRLQPGRVAPFRVAGPGGDARRYAALHGPRADRGVPQSRALGQGRRPGRHLFPRAGPPRAADRPGTRPARPRPSRPPARCACCSTAGRCSTSRCDGPTRRSRTPSRRSSPGAWPSRPSDRYPDAGALAEDLDRFLQHRPLAHAVIRRDRERCANWGVRNRLRLAVVAACLAPLCVPAVGLVAGGRCPGPAFHSRSSCRRS